MPTPAQPWRSAMRITSSPGPQPTSSTRSSAVIASLHRTEIGMLEQGTRLARVDTLMKIAGSLVVSPMELLEGIEWIPGVESEGGFLVVERSLGGPTTARGNASAGALRSAP